MASLGRLQVEIGADTRGLNTGLSDARSRLGAFGAAARRTVNVLGAVGVAAGAAGLALGARMVSNTMQAIDANAKLARQLNATNRGLATLQRAGELAGVGQDRMTTAVRRLDVVIGEAIQGYGRAAESIDRLGISAQELSQMDADQRIAAVNQALRDNVPASERAAVAAQLFGARMATVMSEIDADVIAQAGAEVDAFGLAIDEIDSRTIERANDSMSAHGEMIRGVATRITVELAPYIEGIVTGLRDAAVEGGGLGAAVSSAMQTAGRAVLFAADGVRGLQVAYAAVKAAVATVGAFSVDMFQRMTSAATSSFRQISDRMIGLIDFANSVSILPDIPTGPLEAFNEVLNSTDGFMAELADSANLAAAEAQQSLQNLAMTPMPSETITAWAADAVEAARVASEAAEQARAAMIGGGEGEEGGDGGIAAEREARRAALEQILQDQREYAASELELEQMRHEERMAMLQEQFGQEQELRNLFLEAQRNEQERHEKALQDIKEKSADAQNKITQRSMDTQTGIMTGGYGEMLSAASQFGKAAFGQNKTVSVAMAAVDGIQSAISAWKAGMSTGGPQAPVVAAAYTAASLARTGAMISQLKSQGMSGGGGGAVAGGGGAVAAPSGGGGGGESAGPERNAVINVQGDVFSREGVMSLADQMNELAQDGYQFRLA